MSTSREALETIDQVVPDLDRDHAMQMGELMGAARLADEMVKRFSAQTIRMLQAFRDEKGYLPYGHKTFDDFLDKNPRSPMTRSQFYEREKLIGLEGADAFNALNALRVPISKRKLLAKGDITVSGNEITIGEQKLDLSDDVGVIDAVGILVNRLIQNTQTIERGKKELDTKKRRIDELEEQLSHGGISVDGTAHGRALVGALGELSLLNQEIAKIHDETERARFGLQALEHIAVAKLELEATLGHVAPEGL